MFFRGLAGRLVVVVGSLYIAACTAPQADKLASGNLLSIGQKHLVMQSDDHVMFVSVGELDKRLLQTSLHKGDKITLLGKRDVEEVSAGRSRGSAEVYAIMKEDGTRIALNH